MIIVDIPLCEQPDILQVISIILTIFNVIIIITPVIILIISTLKLISILINKPDDDDFKNAITDILRRTVISVLIIFIPTILMSFMELLDTEIDTKVSSCVTNSQNIEHFREIYELLEAQSNAETDNQDTIFKMMG